MGRDGMNGVKMEWSYGMIINKLYTTTSRWKVLRMEFDGMGWDEMEWSYGMIIEHTAHYNF